MHARATIQATRARGHDARQRRQVQAVEQDGDQSVGRHALAALRLPHVAQQFRQKVDLRTQVTTHWWR
jgi:hypothetical protein